MPVSHQSMCTFKVLKLGKNCKLFQEEQTQVNKKIFMFEQYRQISQRMMNLCKSNLGDIISDYEFLLSILNAFTVGIEEHYTRCNNVNDAKGPQILYHYT